MKTYALYYETAPGTVVVRLTRPTGQQDFETKHEIWDCVGRIRLTPTDLERSKTAFPDWEWVRAQHADGPLLFGFGSQQEQPAA